MPQVWKSIQQYAIDALGGSTNDVFIHVALAQGDNITAINATARQFQPTGLEYVTPTERAARFDSYTADVRAINGSCSHGPGRMFWDKFAPITMDLRSCYSMIQNSERARGRTYDIVVKLRLDEEICAPLKHYSAFDWNKRHEENRIAVWARNDPTDPKNVVVDDHLAVMPRRAADVYLRANEELLTCAPYDAYTPHCGWKYRGTECYLSKWLFFNDVSFDHGATLGQPSYCLWRSPAGPSHCYNCKHRRLRRRLVGPAPAAHGVR